MTPKEKVIRFLGGLGLTYKELCGSAAHSDWEAYLDEGLRVAPFTTGLGILPAERLILSKSAPHWASLVHEAGHLLASPTVLDRKEQEIEWFGWEWAVALHLDLPRDEFLRANMDYGISWDSPEGRYCEDVLHLRPYEVEQFFGEKIEEAKRLGIVTAEGQPVAHPMRRFEAVAVP